VHTVEAFLRGILLDPYEEGFRTAVEMNMMEQVLEIASVVEYTLADKHQTSHICRGKTIENQDQELNREQVEAFCVRLLVEAELAKKRLEAVDEASHCGIW